MSVGEQTQGLGHKELEFMLCLIKTSRMLMLIWLSA